MAMLLYNTIQIGNRLNVGSNGHVITVNQGDLITDNGTQTVNIPIGAANSLLQSDGTQPQWATITTIASTIEHNDLAGLTVGDPHTQYAYLAGRAGGQTLIGGTNASDTLVLQSIRIY